MLESLRDTRGQVGFYYKNLLSGRVVSFQPELPLVAASVIKLPMMIEAFRQFEAGELNPEMPVAVKAEDKVPSCGVLTYLHDGLTVTVRDLVTLSIIVSDNSATNLLFSLLTCEKVNALMDSLGLPITRLRRKMFDIEAQGRGLQNTITAGEIGSLLEGLYRGELVSPEACREMLSILKRQQLHGKIPFRLARSIDIAHKTGEDDGVTHDVGIVFAKEPFVVCFCANAVDVPRFERLMQDISWEFANA